MGIINIYGYNKDGYDAFGFKIDFYDNYLYYRNG